MRAWKTRESFPWKTRENSLPPPRLLFANRNAPITRRFSAERPQIKENARANQLYLLLPSFTFPYPFGYLFPSWIRKVCNFVCVLFFGSKVARFHPRFSFFYCCCRKSLYPRLTTGTKKRININIAEIWNISSNEINLHNSSPKYSERG